MYADAMARTQVYLAKEDVELLERAAARTGASRSELIRRAIRSQYGNRGTVDRLDALRLSAGAWSDHLEAGADYVDARRQGVEIRLGRSGLR